MMVAPVAAALYFIAYTQEYTLACLIRLLAFSAYPLVVAVFGRKGICLHMIFYACVLQAFSAYNNFTEFFIVLVSARMQKKWELPCIAVYTFIANLTLAVQKDSAVHISIHLFCCLFFYLIYFILDRKIARKNLSLTKKEKSVLQALSDGSTQDCIDGYSKSTVARILKNCKERNGCESTSELVDKFTAQKKD